MCSGCGKEMETGLISCLDPKDKTSVLIFHGAGCMKRWLDKQPKDPIDEIEKH